MSGAEYVVGIDLGTSEVKAGLYSVDGAPQATARHSIKLCQPADGRAEQDLDEFYTAASAATARCLADSGVAPGRVVALAVSGQMAGVGIVDGYNRPLAPFDSWLDTRCAEILAELPGPVAARVAALSGAAPSISIGPKMAWWCSRHPEITRQAAAFVTAGGYVAARAAGLTGDGSFIDPTYLHFTAVADAGRAGWDAELIDAFGLRADLLPRVVESTAVVGTLCADAARDFGMPAGIPIAAGCGDTAASAFGADVAEPGQAFDVAGTAAVFGVCLAGFAPDEGGGTVVSMRSPLPGRWYSLAYVGGAGRMVDWVCRTVLGTAAGDESGYEALSAAAGQAPAGSDGLIFSPHLHGRNAPASPDMRGSVVGLSPIHDRRHLARAALESIAFEYRGYLDLIRALAPTWTLEQVVGMGGGSRSAVWNQIKSDVLQAPYRAVQRIEPGTRGAALVALTALQRPRPPLAAEALGPAVWPQAGHAAAYAAAYARYRGWTDVLAETYERHGNWRVQEQQGS